jgi:hypothetical protein
MSCASRCKVSGESIKQCNGRRFNAKSLIECTGVVTSAATVGKISIFTVQARAFAVLCCCAVMKVQYLCCVGSAVLLLIQFIMQAIDSYGAVETDASQIFQISAMHTTENASFNVPLLPQPGCVNGIAIINAGYGCTSPGALVGNGGGGTGFLATFQVINNSISNIVVVDGGHGYSGKPTILVSSGGIGCAGYFLDPIMSLPGDFYGSFITTVSGIYRVKPVFLQKHGLSAAFYNNPDLLGSPFFRVIDNSVEYDGQTRSFSFVNDNVLSASWDGALKIDGGISQPRSGLGRSISRIEVIKRGSGCTSSGIVTSSDGGGTGLLASFSVITYYGFGDVLVSGIGTITLLNPGTGYTSAPNVFLISNSTGCKDYRFQATLTAESGVKTTFHVESDGYAEYINSIFNRVRLCAFISF